MDESGTTGDNLDQTDEVILTYTASDEAIEAASGLGVEGWTQMWRCTSGVVGVCPPQGCPP